METYFYRNKAILLFSSFCILEARDGAVVRAIASYQWPGFKSGRRRHMRGEIVVGFPLCFEKFFSGYSGIPIPSEMVDEFFPLSPNLSYLSSLTCSSLTLVIYPIYLQPRLRSVWMGSSYCRLQEWRERK